MGLRCAGMDGQEEPPGTPKPSTGTAAPSPGGCAGRPLQPPGRCRSGSAAPRSPACTGGSQPLVGASWGCCCRPVLWGHGDTGGAAGAGRARGAEARCSSCARHTQNAAPSPSEHGKIPAHTLPVPLLPQPGPDFTVFIVKRVVGGGFVVVVIFLGSRKGLIPLAALSDVLMIYRHSLGKAGILLPGSLKKLCTGSLCPAGLGDGGKRGTGPGGLGAAPLQGRGPPAASAPFPEPGAGDERAAPFGGSFCVWSHTESPEPFPGAAAALLDKFSVCLYTHKG